MSEVRVQKALRIKIKELDKKSIIPTSMRFYRLGLGATRLFPTGSRDFTFFVNHKWMSRLTVYFNVGLM